MKLVNHRLAGAEVQHLPCPKNRRKLLAAEMIVFHYTAGASALSSARWLAREDVKASAHVVIARDGKVIQLVAFDTEAWHAGLGSYAGRKGLNRYSIGIELDNLGRLEVQDGMFIAECGRVVEPEEVYVDTSTPVPTFWHRYTAAQTERLREVCRLLAAAYPIRHIVGHADITDRKQDPGPEIMALVRPNLEKELSLIVNH